MENDQILSRPEVEPVKHTVWQWVAPGFWFFVIAAWWTLPMLVHSISTTGVHDISLHMEFLTFYLGVAVVAALYVFVDSMSHVWRDYGYWVRFGSILLLFVLAAWLKYVFDSTLAVDGVTDGGYTGNSAAGALIMLWIPVMGAYILFGTLFGIGWTAWKWRKARSFSRRDP